MKREEEIVENVVDKFNNKFFEVSLASAVYDFLIYHNSPNWDLKNVNLIGIGEITNSNSKLISGSLNTIEYINENHNVLIIQNKTDNKICCLLIPPNTDYRNQTDSIFFYGHPAFDEVTSAVTKDIGWKIVNEFDEELEIIPYSFKKPYNLYSFLPFNVQKVNDITSSELSKGQVPALFQIYNTFCHKVK